jgi:hypothetical protein
LEKKLQKFEDAMEQHNITLPRMYCIAVNIESVILAYFGRCSIYARVCIVISTIPREIQHPDVIGMIKVLFIPTPVL